MGGYVGGRVGGLVGLLWVSYGQVGVGGMTNRSRWRSCFVRWCYSVPLALRTVKQQLLLDVRTTNIPGTYDILGAL